MAQLRQQVQYQPSFKPPLCKGAMIAGGNRLSPTVVATETGTAEGGGGIVIPPLQHNSQPYWLNRTKTLRQFV